MPKSTRLVFAEFKQVQIEQLCAAMLAGTQAYNKDPDTYTSSILSKWSKPKASGVDKKRGLFIAGCLEFLNEKPHLYAEEICIFYLALQQCKDDIWQAVVKQIAIDIPYNLEQAVEEPEAKREKTLNYAREYLQREACFSNKAMQQSVAAVHEKITDQQGRFSSEYCKQQFRPSHKQPSPEFNITDQPFKHWSWLEVAIFASYKNLVLLTKCKRAAESDNGDGLKEVVEDYMDRRKNLVGRMVGLAHESPEGDKYAYYLTAKHDLALGLHTKAYPRNDNFVIGGTFLAVKGSEKPEELRALVDAIMDSCGFTLAVASLHAVTLRNFLQQSFALNADAKAEVLPASNPDAPQVEGGSSATEEKEGRKSLSSSTKNVATTDEKSSNATASETKQPADKKDEVISILQVALRLKEFDFNELLEGLQQGTGAYLRDRPYFSDYLDEERDINGRARASIVDECLRFLQQDATQFRPEIGLMYLALKQLNTKLYNDYIAKLVQNKTQAQVLRLEEKKPETLDLVSELLRRDHGFTEDEITDRVKKIVENLSVKGVLNEKFVAWSIRAHAENSFKIKTYHFPLRLLISPLMQYKWQRAANQNKLSAQFSVFALYGAYRASIAKKIESLRKFCENHFYGLEINSMARLFMHEKNCYRGLVHAYAEAQKRPKVYIDKDIATMLGTAKTILSEDFVLPDNHKNTIEQYEVKSTAKETQDFTESNTQHSERKFSYVYEIFSSLLPDDQLVMLLVLLNDQFGCRKAFNFSPFGWDEGGIYRYLIKDSSDLFFSYPLLHSMVLEIGVIIDTNFSLAVKRKYIQDTLLLGRALALAQLSPLARYSLVENRFSAKGGDQPEKLDYDYIDRFLGEWRAHYVPNVQVQLSSVASAPLLYNVQSDVKDAPLPMQFNLPASSASLSLPPSAPPFPPMPSAPPLPGSQSPQVVPSLQPQSQSQSQSQPQPQPEPQSQSQNIPVPEVPNNSVLAPAVPKNSESLDVEVEGSDAQGQPPKPPGTNHDEIKHEDVPPVPQSSPSPTPSSSSAQNVENSAPLPVNSSTNSSASSNSSFAESRYLFHNQQISSSQVRLKIGPSGLSKVIADNFVMEVEPGTECAIKSNGISLTFTSPYFNLQFATPHQQSSSLSQTKKDTDKNSEQQSYGYTLC